MLLIGLSKPINNKIGSALIRAYEGTSGSHVYIRFYSQKYDLWLVYEAAHGQVRFIEYNNWLKINTPIGEKEIKCTEQQKDAIVKKCMKLSSVKYGYLTLLGIALHLYKLTEDGEKSFICTEIASDLLKIVGIDMPKYSLKAYQKFILDEN